MVKKVRVYPFYPLYQWRICHTDFYGRYGFTLQMQYVLQQANLCSSVLSVTSVGKYGTRIILIRFAKTLINAYLVQLTFPYIPYMV